EHHGEHFEEDTIDVIFRLLFGEAKRVDLNAVAEAAELLFPDAVTIAQDFIPKVDEGAHLAHFSDEANPRIDEETDPSRGFRKVLRCDLAAVPHRIKNGNRGCKCEGKLLHRRRAGLLK